MLLAPLPALPGTTRPGTACGAAATITASTNRAAVVVQRTVRRHGRVFSAVITAATTAIHTRLITPSAKSAAMRAQQHPTHHAACLDPISTAPADPSRQSPSRKPSGLRHLARHAFFSGVSSYTAAAAMTAAAAHRPPASHDSCAPNQFLPSSKSPYEKTPTADHTRRYAAVKRTGRTGLRRRVIREYSATVGATDGNIIAAIISTQTPTNHPRAPRSVPGPASMPAI